jgi:NTE family protein
LWLGLPLLLTALALPVDAAEPVTPAPTAKRPKICLVLSGGGARGAAHVGVLKVLEEYRVPVHCIAGTSMGSLVGAAYASGTTVPEMDQIMASITTELLFKEKPPRAQVTMRRKADDYKAFFGPEIGVTGGKISLGKGVVTGVQLETVLRQLSKIKGYQNFDKLPIPYRAVATDLVNGKAVVFKSGELANVMRASMAVPGAVAPAEFDGMMLVDGMLTSNLPVDAARAMGADVVIAVNVGTPLLKRDELNGIGGVVGQMLSILTEQNVQESLASLKPDDILITPELEGYSTGDFDNLTKIAPLGEPAARKVADRLARLSIPAAEYAALRQRQMVAVVPDTRPVDEIRFENLALVNPESVRRSMETKARRADRPEKARHGHAPHLWHGRLRARQLPLTWRSPASACWRWTRWKNPGGPTACASASACPAISPATRNTTCSFPIANAGSTRWARSGEPTCNSAATTAWGASSISR